MHQFYSFHYCTSSNNRYCHTVQYVAYMNIGPNLCTVLHWIGLMKKCMYGPFWYVVHTPNSNFTVCTSWQIVGRMSVGFLRIHSLMISLNSLII